MGAKHKSSLRSEVKRLQPQWRGISMKLTTIFRHYSKFQSQWKVNYFEQHCDWEQLPNWKQSSDFKAAKQQQGKNPNNWRHHLAAAPASSVRPHQPLQQMWSSFPTGGWVTMNLQHNPRAQQCSWPPLQQLLQLCRDAGAGEHPKGELDPRVHSTGQDSCTHSLWECWCCSESAQAELHREPGSWVHPAGNAAARSSAHVLHAGRTGDFHIPLTITHRSYQSSWKKSDGWLAMHSSSSAQSPMKKSPPPESKCPHQVIWSQQNQPKELQLNSQESWKSPWMQCPNVLQRSVRGEAAGTPRCHFHLLKLSPGSPGYTRRGSSPFLRFLTCVFPAQELHLRQLRSKQADRWHSTDLSQLSISKTPVKAAVL